MAANTIFANSVKSHSEVLLRCAKYLCDLNDHPSKSIVSIKLGKTQVEELARLCAQVDETARTPIEAVIQKAQTKLAFAEKVNEYLREKNESVDPRVEKLIVKITQVMESSKTDSNSVAYPKLFKLQNKLNSFLAMTGHNPMTAEAFAKAHKMLVEFDMQIQKKPAPSFPPLPLSSPSILVILQTPSDTSSTSNTPSSSYSNVFGSFPPSMPYAPAPPFITSALDSLPFENEEEEEELDNIGMLGILCPALVGLYEASEELSCSEEGDIASLNLDDLKNVKWQDSGSTVLDRVFFHLCQIQNVETPGKVDRNAHQWGKRAFQTEELSTPYQKLGAIHRTRVELLLHLLEKEISGHKHNELSENFFRLVNALEKLMLDPNEILSGENTVADALYAKFLQAYDKAREGHPSWLDPNNEKDFGHRAFSGQYAHGEIDFNPMRLEAVRALVQELKTTWRI